MVIASTQREIKCSDLGSVERSKTTTDVGLMTNDIEGNFLKGDHLVVSFVVVKK